MKEVRLGSPAGLGTRSTPFSLPHRAVCLACVQPAVFPWILPFGSNKDRPRPAHGALTGKSVMLFWFTPGFRRLPSSQTDNLPACCGSVEVRSIRSQHPSLDGRPLCQLALAECLGSQEWLKSEPGLPLTEEALVLKRPSQAHMPGLVCSPGVH